jgi:AraC-like DNA-binding protein
MVELLMSAQSHLRTNFTIADFERMGKRSGFKYQLRLPEHAKFDEHSCIAEGDVVEHTLRSGGALTISDLAVHQRYESMSSMTSQFSVIVILAGTVHAQLAQHDYLSLNTNYGFSALYDEAASLRAIHPADQHLRSINVQFPHPDSCADCDAELCECVYHLMRTSAAQLRRWPVPQYLLQSITHWLMCDWDEPLLQLFGDGLANQLLAEALSTFRQRPSQANGVSSRDRQRLERVREHLRTHPGEQHTLANLANLACMSPSTLRAKFQTAYSCTIFQCLRDHRLEIARELLSQGCNVQQTAYKVGYRHASNFATAFRQRYGFVPSQYD